MGGTLMWIILGGLIGLVAIFLVVTSILDKKKREKVLVEKQELSKQVRESGTNVSKEVIKVINKNDKDLKNFVPSVGKTKMSDINFKAKYTLLKIKKSQSFKLLRHNDEENNEFTKHLDALIQEKSNNWSKRNVDDINFFKTYKPVVAEKEEKSKTKKSSKKKGKK